MDEFWMLARQAAWAILVWDDPDAELSRWLVYRPFWRLIPMASLT